MTKAKNDTAVYISVQDAAKLLSISRRTVYRMIDADKLEAYKIGRATRVKREDVLNLPERWDNDENEA